MNGLSIVFTTLYLKKSAIYNIQYLIHVELEIGVTSKVT